MANLSFPADPTVGDTYTPEGLFVIYTWNGEYWEANSVNSFDSRFVELNGDNMTGNLTLGGDKITLNEADGSAQFAGDITSTTRIQTLKDNGNKTSILGGSTTYAFSASNDGGTTRTVQLNYDGSASFANRVKVGDAALTTDSTNAFLAYTTAGSAGGARVAITCGGSATFAGKVSTSAYFSSDRTSAGVAVFEGQLNSTQTSLVKADGDATFAGEIKGERFVTNVGDSVTFYAGESGIDAKSTNPCYLQLLDPVAVKSKFYVKANGYGYFAGNITSSNVTFNLEADDDTKYTTTTDVDGNESRIYNGATLDVKEMLLNFQAKIQTLEAAKAALEARVVTLETQQSSGN